MWGTLVAGILARPWARRLTSLALVALTVALFIINLRRTAERAGRAAERLNQMERAFQRAVYEIVKIERRIEDEEVKLADAKRQNSHAVRRRSVRATD